MPPVPSLEDELQLLKISVERSSDEVFWLDFEGNILYANDAASRITGYSPKELCAMKIAGLDPTITPELWNRLITNLRENKTGFATSRHRCKNGTFIDVDILAVYVNYGDKEYSFAYVREITERKQAEKLLQETDRKYRLLADHVHDVIWTTDKNMHFTYISPSVTTLRGLAPEEAMKETFREALTPESYLVLMEDRRRGLEAQKKGGSIPRNIVLELEFRKKDGSTVWTDMAITPVFDQSGMPAGAVGIIRDITLRRQAEKKLRESQEKLRTVLDNLPDLVIVHRDGIILYVNPPMIDNMGIPPENVLNKPVLDYIPPRYHARIVAAIRSRMETGKDESYEIELESPAKGPRVVLIRGSVIDFDGAPAILNVLTDVTEQKRAEEALRESEEKFRSFVENANDIVFSLTPEGITTYVSPNWTEILGHDPAEIIGKPVRHIHPEDFPRVREFIRQTMRTGKKAGGIEYRIQQKDGAWQWHTQNVTPVHDTSGRVVAIHGICHNITERKRAEEALRESRQQLSEAMDIASLVDWEYDAATDLFTFNDRFYALYGTTAGREGGMQMSSETYAREFIHPDDQYFLFREIEKILKTTDPGYRAQAEHRIIRRDGEIRYIIVRIGVVLDAEGRLIRTHGANQDITERKRLEEALRGSEEKFRSFVENANDIIYTLTAEGIFTYVSPKWTELLGHEVSEVIGRSFDFFIHPDDLPVCHEFVQQILTTGQKGSGIEYRIRHRNGTWYWHTTTGSPLRDSQGKIISYLGLCRDITDRKLAEQALRQSEAKYRAIIENIQDLVYQTDLQGRLTMISPAGARLAGYSTSEEMMGRNVGLEIYADPKEREAFLAVLKEKGTVIDYPVTLVDRYGNHHHATASSHFYTDEQGNILGVEGVLHDVTEQRKAEEAVRQANKKLSLLSSITRHDINNQLLTLNGFVELLRMKIPDPALENYFSRIKNASSQITAMIRFTKEYEEIGVHAPVWQDLYEIADSAGKDVLPEGIVLKNELPSGGMVFADPLIVKVFFNLIDNALRHGGKVTTIRFSYEVRGGDRIIVCEDDGEGVSSEEKERIFDRGFGKNTGFGLSITREILDITGITIRETGEPGKGARFEILVPKGVFRISGA